MPRKIIFPLLLISTLLWGVVESWAQPTSVDTLSTVDPTCVVPDGGQITIEVVGGIDPYFITVIYLLDNGTNDTFGFNGAPGQTIFTFPDLGLGQPAFSAGSYNFVVADQSGLTESLLNIRLDINDPVISVLPPQPFEFCSVNGPIDLLDVISIDQPGGTFTFSGPPGSLNGSIFNTLGLSGIVTIDIEYQLGVCNTVFETFVFDISSGSLPNTGPDQVICSNDVVNLNGSIIDNPSAAIWTTTGTGSFDDATSLTTIYRPSAADITSGMLDLILTTTADPDGPGPCEIEDDSLHLTINPEATVMVSADQTICAGDVVSVSGSFGGAATNATWSTSGSGNFDNNGSLTPTYTPSAADIAAGQAILILTTNDPDGAGPCPPVSDILVVTIDPPAIAAAGADQNICAGDSVVLSGSIGGVATSATWSTSGSGTFDDVASLNTLYRPSAADNAAGMVTLTLTTDDPAGPCPAVSDDIIITIDEPAVVSAGADMVICADETATMMGSFGGGATGATWSSSGTGTFDDPTSPNSVYTPSNDDISSGTVTLTFTTNDPAGACPAVVDDIIITINPIATVNAGADQEICAGDLVVITGNIGGSAASATWSTSGSGTFDDVASLNTIYRPSAADSSAGMVTLTLTTDDPVGPCPVVTDEMLVTINEPAIVSAGPDQEICADQTATMAGSFGGSATGITWSTSGTGTFDDPTNPAAIYNPSADDITNGMVILTITTSDPAGACPAVTNELSLIIHPLATVNAGADQLVCSGDVINITGIIGGAASSATWSTSGSGTFDDANSLTTIYHPSTGDNAAGAVILTLTTDDPSGPCPASIDDLDITINQAATVTTSADKTICANETANITGSIGGSAVSALWSTNGTGAFDDNTSLTTIYSPSANDIGVGLVTLTLTTNDPDGNGPCLQVSNDLILTINPAAIVSAGPDQTICAGDQIALSGSLGGSASSATWSSDGSGFFDDVNSLNAIYTPSAADLSVGNISLTLTSNDPSGPCPEVEDLVVVTINEPAIVEAGANQTVCEGEPIILAGMVGGSATSGLWTTGGGGTFDDASNLNAIYNPSQSDFDAGMVVLTLSALDPDGNGPCPQVDDILNISFLDAPIADAGVDQTICFGDGVALSATGGISYSWLPVEGLSDPNIANPVATPDQTVAYTVTVTDVNGCSNTDEVTVNVIVTEPPNIDPPIDPFDICINEAQPFTLTGMGMNIRWYSDAGLTNVIRNGPTLTPTADELDLTVPGSTSFYVTQDIGCGEGPSNSVTINILPEDDPRCVEPCPEVTYDFTSSDLFCPGDSNGAFTVSNIFSDKHLLLAYLEIFLNDVSLGRVDTISRSLTVDTLAAGEYTLSVRQIGGCFNSLERTFMISEPANAVAGTVEELNAAADEEPTGSFKVLIDPANGTAPYMVSLELIDAKFPPQTLFFDFADAPLNSSSGQHEIQFNNLVAGTYRITIRDGNGCEIAFDQVVGSDGKIFIPNIFTPNDDQSNQTFFIRNLPKNGATLMIANRWGKIIFEATNYQNNWDGGDQPDGTYYYRLVTEDQSYKGWVEIWRGNTP